MTPPVLLLHAFPFDGSFWDRVLARLDGLQTSAPDLVASGGASLLPASIDEMADRIARRIESAHPAVVVGCSMGGYVALSLALRYRLLVAGLVLVDTRGEADTSDARTGREASRKLIQREGVAAFVGDLVPRLIADRSTDCLAEALRIAERQTPDAVLHAIAALRDRPDRSDQLHEIRVPTLVIVGELDVVTPPAVAEGLRDQISGATLAVVSNAGHLSPIEQPVAVAGLIRTFVADL